MLSGVQGSGKSAFFADRFFATHVRISRDLLRTPHREARFLELCFETRQKLVVDKVNATRADRRPYLDAARAAGFRAIACRLDVEPRDAIARNAARAPQWRVPPHAILATHVRISRDLLRTPHREQRLLELCLETRQPFAVDKVNATPGARRPYVEAAREAGFRTAAWFVDTPPREAIARNARREDRSQVPVKAILGTRKTLVPPSFDEGFDEIWHVWADGRGGFHVQQREATGGEEPRFVRDAAPAR